MRDPIEQQQETMVLPTERSQFDAMQEQIDEFKDKKSVEEPLIPVTPTLPRREINLPDEPSADNKNAAKLVLRMPQSGERIARNFLRSDRVALLYDFVDWL